MPLSGLPGPECRIPTSCYLHPNLDCEIPLQQVLETLHNQYRKLAELVPDKHILLWFDACLFDQSMLAHILTCLLQLKARGVELLCVDRFPGIEPYHGIGQLQPDQLASLYDNRRPVTELRLQPFYCILIRS